MTESAKGNKGLLGNMLFTLAVCLTVMPLYLTGRDIDSSAAFEITNFLIIMISAFEMTTSTQDRAFCTSTFFYTFVLFFFGVAPMIQYINYTTFWGGKPIEASVFVWLNILILIIIAVYELTYRLLSNHLTALQGNFAAFPANLKDTMREVVNVKVVILLSVLVTILAFYYYRDEPAFMFFREIGGDEHRKFEAENLSLHLLFIHFLRPIPVIVWTLYNLCSGKKKFWVVVTLGTLALVSNFPLSLSRNYLAAVYIPLVCSLMKNLIRKRYVIIAIMCSAMLYLFPLMNQNRTIADIEDFKFATSFKMFNQGHFDSYQNFARIISIDLVTYGRQLLGGLLFFVPRSIWPDKPVGSGWFIADMFEYEHSNISMPFFAEGYINFSYFGILLFTLLLGMLNAYMDFRYYSRSNGIRFQLIYITYCSMLIFNMRGDLISSYAYSVGALCSIVTVCALCIERVSARGQGGCCRPDAGCGN